MRPYRFGDVWIDLDTVQAISEPRFADRMGYGGYFIEMEIQFAFQDKSRQFQWGQETVWRNKAGDVVDWRGHDDNCYLAPKLDEAGEPTQLVEIRDRFNQLLEAWSK